MNPRFKPLTAALSIAFLAPAHAGEILDPVVVTATRQPVRESQLLSDVTVVERADLEVAGQSTLAEVLSRQPGLQLSVNGRKGATTSLFMRGSNSNQVLVLIDGVRAGSATTGSAAWSRIPVSQIERIEILRGAASSLYGADAIGGVIQIFTRSGQGPFKLFGEIGGGSRNTFMANAGFSGSSEGWSYALNVASEYTRGFNSISNPRNTSYNADDDGFRQNSVSGKLAYEFVKGHEFGASVLYSDGENKYDSGFTPATAARDYRSDQSVASFNAYLRDAFTPYWTSTMRAGQSVDDARQFENHVRTSTFRTRQTQYVWQNDFTTGIVNFLAAIERLEQGIDGTTTYNTAERSINSALAGWTGKYEAHHLQANVRIDDNSQFGDKTTGSVAYGYQFTPNWRANAGYGTAFKAPTFNELYFPGFGNPALKPETSHTTEATVHFETGLHHVSLTAYRNNVDDLIVTVGPIGPNFIFRPENVGRAQITGATLAYDGRIESFNLMANYDYLDPRNEDTGKLLPRRAKQYGTVAVGQQLAPFEWRVEMQASDYRYDNVANTRKLAGYAIFNLYGAYQLGGGWSAFARINNLFDRDYETAADYATTGLNAFVGLRYTPQ